MCIRDRESAIALWKRMKESCEVSDVLVLNQNGEIHCYYVNEDYPQLLSGFIRLNPSGTSVSYTHLDVYKRQPDKPTERGEPYLWNDCSANIKCGAEPV